MTRTANQRLRRARNGIRRRRVVVVENNQQAPLRRRQRRNRARVQVMSNQGMGGNMRPIGARNVTSNRSVRVTNGNRRTRRGNRSGILGPLLQAGGSIAGTLLGNPAAGAAAGTAISRIFGQGDYQVQSNTLTQGGPPTFAELSSGIRMSHREYVGDVTSSIDFKNTAYQIIPTNSTLFPWLSSIAGNFEEYVLMGMVVYFNTTCGSAISSTNNALGVIGMTTVYDPTDAEPATKREMEDYMGCVSGVPSNSLIHPVECKPRSNVLDRLYIQAGTVVTNPEDLKFYSHGMLNVFTQGMQQAGVTIGELWVSYDIMLYSPKILPIGTLTPVSGYALTSVITPSTTSLFGNSALRKRTGNLIIGLTDNRMTINAIAPGTYSVYLRIVAGSTTDQTIQPTAYSSNITAANIWNNNANTIYSPETGKISVEHAIEFTFKKSDNKAGYIDWTNYNSSFLVTWTIEVLVTKLGNETTGGSGTFQIGLTKIAPQVKFSGDDVIAITKTMDTLPWFNNYIDAMIAKRLAVIAEVSREGENDASSWDLQ